jgi:hypothetical protein
LTYRIKLNNKIAALGGVVASADAAPTSQAVEVFEMLSARLAEQLAKLAPILRTDVPALQALAKKRGLTSRRAPSPSASSSRSRVVAPRSGISVSPASVRLAASATGAASKPKLAVSR